jgi:hypothetical protein
MAFPLIAAALGLAEFAPMIARWLGGRNAENIASDVVNIAKRITHTDDPYEAIQSLQREPQLVLEFQKAVLQKESDLEAAYLHDRQSARSRDMAFIQAGVKNTRADIMVCAAALGLCMCLLALGCYADNLPGEAVGIISTIAGIFGACLKDAYAFEFGSSRGSKEKDKTVAQMMDEFTRERGEE